MAVGPQQLLQPDMGRRLPVDVRSALVAMGMACNQATMLMHNAFGFSMQVQSLLDSQRASEPASRLAVQVAEDLRDLSDQNFEQAIVVLARAGAVYANYASQVAVALAENTSPPLPQLEPIRPSDVITACGHYLPEVSFEKDSDEPSIVGEQNQAIADARRHLNNLITHHLQSENVLAYDEIAAVAITRADDGDRGRSAEFADALHVYAGVLVWAIGVFSGADPDDAGPTRTA
ncbi:hypothetical protein [Actinoplanes sp. NPDC026619]|uniref:hypothetical protein n=1 Tax=Actinoplanes sp. NPDC026619 TaxID=3155798 RepID=UPI0033F29EAD